jgi:hypothetical protein
VYCDRQRRGVRKLASENPPELQFEFEIFILLAPPEPAERVEANERHCIQIKLPAAP